MFERRAEKNERGGDDIPFEEWQAIVSALFAPETFAEGNKLASAAPTRPSNVIWRHRWKSAAAVRQIGVEHQACPEDYPTAVAVYLLRRGMYLGKDRQIIKGEPSHLSLRNAWQSTFGDRIDETARWPARESETRSMDQL